MFAKVIVAALALAAAQAAQYPAGVHPAICPDYPNCDTALLARFTPDGQPIPPWGLAAVAPVDTQYPAGVAPASCPNYPYCGSDLAAPATRPASPQLPVPTTPTATRYHDPPPSSQQPTPTPYAAISPYLTTDVTCRDAEYRK